MVKKPHLVLRRSVPWNGSLQRIGGVLALLVAGALVYEVGSRQLGVARVILGEEAVRARELAELRRRNQSLESRVQVLEASLEMDGQAYRLVEGALQELQEELLRKERELQFYQGIVSPEDDFAGLRIQRFQVLEQRPNRFLLRMVLVQALSRDDRVSGQIEMHLHGQRDGESVSLPLADLVSEEQSTVDSFSFRYFQELGQELELPADLTVERIEIELSPAGGDRPAVRESFDWQASLQEEGA